MTTTTIRTEPFTCPSCINKIESVVGRMDGVGKVEVKFNSSRVKVEHDDAAVSAKQLAERVESLGYPVLSVS